MKRQGDSSREVRVSVLADTGVRKELWGWGEAGWGRAYGDTTEVQAPRHHLLPCCGVHTNLRLCLVNLLHDIALSNNQYKEDFLYFSIISEVSILYETIYDSFVSTVKSSSGIFERYLNIFIMIKLKVKLKIRYQRRRWSGGRVSDELAEGKDTNSRVLRAEELDDEGDALGGGDDEGKLGGIEEADGHLGSPAV